MVALMADLLDSSMVDDLAGTMAASSDAMTAVMTVASMAVSSVVSTVCLWAAVMVV